VAVASAWAPTEVDCREQPAITGKRRRNAHNAEIEPSIRLVRVPDAINFSGISELNSSSLVRFIAAGSE
jgi:hypothetical protein